MVGIGSGAVTDIDTILDLLRKRVKIKVALTRRRQIERDKQ